ncbi:MAG: helix-hairpin-helix domain-containing protein [Bacteroidia bacterium]|nr:helix-hairpin-helix domain-containing protein [Bacteroidia bacterium]
MTKFYRYLFTRSELRGVLILSSGVILIRLLAYSISPMVSDSNGDTVAIASEDQTSQARRKPKILEINSADSIALDELPGIGPAFARRIIKYREKLGGFAYPEQLKEVYGMDSARLAGFIKLISIDTSRIRKMDINKATFKELLAHPYLEYEQVKAIARFRDKKGLLVSTGELWAAGILVDSLWGCLSHYITVVSDSTLKENKILVK